MMIIESFQKVGLIRPLYYCVFCAMFFYSCSSDLKKNELRHDYYPSKTEIKYAINFKVNYSKSYKILDVFENGDSLNPVQRYYLVEHGTKLPEMEENSISIRIPLTSTSCLSTTQISYLALLDQLDKISGVGHADFIKNEAIQKQLEEGWTMEITRSGQLDKELVLQSNTSLLMANAFDRSGLEELKSLEIPIIYSSEYSESSMLARAEWIKFFALFFNSEARADEIFLDIEREYLATKKIIESAPKNKNAMFGSYYQGLWFVPGGASLMSNLLEDAGVNYIYKSHETAKNIQIDTESLLNQIDSISYWGVILSKDNEVNSNDFVGEDSRIQKEVLKKNIHFFYSNSNKVDYFGKAGVEPQVLLKDLGKIFHPELFPKHQFVYFQSIN